jgi:CheY-like chemotaxis protein
MKKLLLTDDSNMGRRMVKKAIKDIFSDDIELIEAQNGQEALQAYKDNSPHICFMDLTMPVMDGYEATKLITEFDKDAKVIIVSADIQSGAFEKTKQNGALAFIKKPIDVENLKSTLKNLGLIS